MRDFFLSTLTEQQAWRILLGLKRQLKTTGINSPALGFTADGACVDGSGVLTIDREGRWLAHIPIAPEAAVLLNLYLPLLHRHDQSLFVLAHLGQSLDGRIATETGHSHYINGHANLVHLHRLRALLDGVVVGASTVELDDPRLTTRLVEGDNPTRVILDPQLRLPPERTIFCDGAALTLQVCSQAQADGMRWARADSIIAVPTAANGTLDLRALCEQLPAYGVRSLLVEGGGVTVSAFLQAGLLDRLQIAVAPLLIGSGRPSVRLPPIADLNQALRPRVTWIPMGDDLLFDCLLGG